MVIFCQFTQDSEKTWIFKIFACWGTFWKTYWSEDFGCRSWCVERIGSVCVSAFEVVFLVNWYNLDRVFLSFTRKYITNAYKSSFLIMIWLHIHTKCWHLWRRLCYEDSVCVNSNTIFRGARGVNNISLTIVIFQWKDVPPYLQQMKIEIGILMYLWFFINKSRKRGKL